jgi:hypothetical protein
MMPPSRGHLQTEDSREGEMEQQKERKEKGREKSAF